VDDPPDRPVVVLQRLGLPDEALTEVAWDELDRAIEPDHLTAIYVPQLAAPVAGEVQRFVELVTTLRAECPWDAEQTHATLARHLLEESYEVLEALDELGDGGPDVDPDGYTHLEEELGDLLFQVVFHATLGAERGAFDLADVARGIHDKLVRRHPHVFGDAAGVDTPDKVLAQWDKIKEAEKPKSKRILDGVPHGPALSRAQKIGTKAGKVGFDWPGWEGSFAKVEEEVAEVGEAIRTKDAAATHQEIGDLLLAVVNLARKVGVDAENALLDATERFRNRFEFVEDRLGERGKTPQQSSLEEMDALWNDAKRALR